jgi:hypothetical protein
MENFDPSIRRKKYSAHKVFNRLRCPRCRTRLEPHDCAYLMAADLMDGSEIQMNILNGPYGSFCPHCPIVVLDEKIISTSLIESLRNNRVEVTNLSVSFIGIVDLNAFLDEEGRVPQDKENATPLAVAEFVQEIEGGAAIPGAQPGGKRLSGNQRRRQRKQQAQD